MKSPNRLYLEKVLFENWACIKGNVLNVGGGPKPYRDLCPDMINMDLFVFPEVNVRADVKEFPFMSRSFDTVMCTQVLEHVENPWRVVEEIDRVMKKNGVLILSVPFLERYHPDPKDYWRFTEDGIKKMLEGKFKIVKMEPVGGRCVLLSTFMYQHSICRYFANYMRRLFFYLDKYDKNKCMWSYGFFVVAKKT